LSLKENINAVKQEISTEEQFLESLIKGERFFKKYKKIIISLGIIAILALLAYGVTTYMHQSKIEKANEAYAKLLKNPKDSKALQALQANDKKLFELFSLSRALQDEDKAKLLEISKLQDSPILSDIAFYQLNSLENKDDKKTKLLKGMSLLHEGYALLLKGKIEEAKLKFAQITQNSPLKNVANNLEHYQGK
jgi:hypothetical protein